MTTSSSAEALAGCCKERTSINGQWKITRLPLEDCKERNKADEDSIVKPTGLIWWDIAC